MKREQPPSSLLDGTVSTLSPAMESELRGWLGLAIASLAVAGMLALVAVVARTPGLRDLLLPWPWQDFFPKVIIAHVSLSVIVWYLSIFGVLVVLATARVSTDRGKLHQRGLGVVGLTSTVLGSALLLVPVLLNWGEASLNNYVPVVVHPLFYFGLVFVMTGILLVVLRLLINLSGKNLGPFEHGIAATGVTFLIALSCFSLSWVALPAGIEPALANERLFWGGGHVLQFVNTMLMLVAWRVLAEQAINMALPNRLFVSAVWMLMMVALLSISFCRVFDLFSREYREAFTQLLQYGLPLPPALIATDIAIRLLRFHHIGLRRNIPALSLLLSFLLFTTGGALGYFLSAGDTRIPSHYHAVIGSVNLAVMGITFTTFLPILHRPRPMSEVIRWQLLLYGGGQLVFSVGMFAAGVAGVPRKTAGLEQNIDTLAKYGYMIVYSIGGVAAIGGGLMFVWMVIASLLPQWNRR